MKKILVFGVIIFIAACNSGNKASNGGDSIVYSYENIPAERKNINPNPVKTYTETVKSFATTDEFKVELFETKQTFSYLIKMSFKNLDEEDTLHIPNFGMMPSVEIQKSDSIRPSCVIGFLDQDKKFKESKLVYFENNEIKVHVLKHYGVFAK